MKKSGFLWLSSEQAGVLRLSRSGELGADSISRADGPRPGEGHGFEELSGSGRNLCPCPMRPIAWQETNAAPSNPEIHFILSLRIALTMAPRNGATDESWFNLNLMARASKLFLKFAGTERITC